MAVVSKCSIRLVLGVFAAAVAGCGSTPPATSGTPSGTTTVVVPRLLGADVATAVAEVQYLRFIPAVVDRDHRTLFSGGDGDNRCMVVAQRPRARTEVVVSELTVTVTITVRCRRSRA